MREQLEHRLQQLKDEYAQGEKTLEDLQTKTISVQRVMLRLSGAIQVLEEELAADTPNSASHAANVTNGNNANNANNVNHLNNGSHNGAEPGASVPPLAPAAFPVE